MADIYITTTVTEFAPADEIVVATIDVRCMTGESFMGPTIVGLYRESGNPNPDLWVEQEGRRVQLPISCLPALVKQLRRAEKIAREASNG